MDRKYIWPNNSTITFSLFEKCKETLVIWNEAIFGHIWETSLEQEILNSLIFEINSWVTLLISARKLKTRLSQLSYSKRVKWGYQKLFRREMMWERLECLHHWERVITQSFKFKSSGHKLLSLDRWRGIILIIMGQTKRTLRQVKEGLNWIKGR